MTVSGQERMSPAVVVVPVVSGQASLLMSRDRDRDRLTGSGLLFCRSLGRVKTIDCTGPSSMP